MGNGKLPQSDYDILVALAEQTGIAKFINEAVSMKGGFTKSCAILAYFPSAAT
jgi:hypothetical protein